MRGDMDTGWRMGRDPGRWRMKEKIQGMLLRGGGCPKDREVQGRRRIRGRSFQGEVMVQGGWLEGQEGR